MTKSIQAIKSVLLLDDDVLQAKALSKKLQKGGYQITGVTYTGVQAIASAQQQLPDIALLDINLHGQQIDGIEVGTALQQLHPNIIIIYITAYANDEHFHRALDSKPYAFIEKPYQMKHLYREIEMAVQKVVDLKVDQKEIIPSSSNTSPSTGMARLLCFPNSILLKEGVGAGHQKILVADILYLKADGNFTYIYTRTKQIYATLSLKTFEEALHYQNLLRVHNSFMVNLTNVAEIHVNSNGGQLVLVGGETVSVARSYAKKFWVRWQECGKEV